MSIYLIKKEKKNSKTKPMPNNTSIFVLNRFFSNLKKTTNKIIIYTNDRDVFNLEIFCSFNSSELKCKICKKLLKTTISFSFFFFCWRRRWKYKSTFIGIQGVLKAKQILQKDSEG